MALAEQQPQRVPRLIASKGGFGPLFFVGEGNGQRALPFGNPLKGFALENPMCASALRTRLHSIVVLYLQSTVIRQKTPDDRALFMKKNP